MRAEVVGCAGAGNVGLLPLLSVEHVLVPVERALELAQLAKLALFDECLEREEVGVPPAVLVHGEDEAL